MDFSQALLAAKAGKRVRRAFWVRDLEGRVGTHMEISDVLPPLGPVMICPAAGQGVNLFACSQVDILADDWELVP